MISHALRGSRADDTGEGRRQELLLPSHRCGSELRRPVIRSTPSIPEVELAVGACAAAPVPHGKNARWPAAYLSPLPGAHVNAPQTGSPLVPRQRTLMREREIVCVVFIGKLPQVQPIGVTCVKVPRSRARRNTLRPNHEGGAIGGERRMFDIEVVAHYRKACDLCDMNTGDTIAVLNPFAPEFADKRHLCSPPVSGAPSGRAGSRHTVFRRRMCAFTAHPIKSSAIRRATLSAANTTAYPILAQIPTVVITFARSVSARCSL